jgi:hypothetical protein
LTGCACGAPLLYTTVGPEVPAGVNVVPQDLLQGPAERHRVEFSGIVPLEDVGFKR